MNGMLMSNFKFAGGGDDGAKTVATESYLWQADVYFRDPAGTKRKLSFASDFLLGPGPGWVRD